MFIRTMFTNFSLIGFFILGSTQVAAQGSLEMQEALKKAQEQPWAVEVYYIIRDGHEQEFLDLYKKNHWPVLNAEIEEGSLISVEIDTQRFAAPGPHQWDFRVKQVYTNILYHHGLLERKKEEITSRLFPDRELFDREEKHRMQLIEYATMLEGTSVPTAQWPTANTQ